jgi:hypothetical protein
VEGGRVQTRDWMAQSADPHLRLSHRRLSLSGGSLPLNRPCQHGLHPPPHENSLERHWRRNRVECGIFSYIIPCDDLYTTRAFCTAFRRMAEVTPSPLPMLHHSWRQDPQDERIRFLV